MEGQCTLDGGRAHWGGAGRLYADKAYDFPWRPWALRRRGNMTARGQVTSG